MKRYIWNACSVYRRYNWLFRELWKVFNSFHVTSIFLYPRPLVYFYTPWKHQKTSVFLMFLGGIERDQWHEMGKIIKTFVLLIEFFSSQNLFWFSWVLIKIFWSFKEKLYWPVYLSKIGISECYLKYIVQWKISKLKTRFVFTISQIHPMNYTVKKEIAIY